MYSLVLKRKREVFKKNNQSLFNLIVVVITLSSPVLILFAPVPGFLLLNKTQMIESIAAGAFIFFILAVLESLHYWLYWKKEEIEYLNYVSSPQQVIKDSFISLLKSSIIFHAAVISTFVRAPEVSPYSIMSFLVLTYPLLFLVFVMTYKNKLKGRGLDINVPVHLKTLSLLLKGGLIIKLLCLGVLTLTNYIVTSAISNEEAKMFSFLIFSGICLFLSYIIYDTFNINLKTYHLYLKSISENLLIKIKAYILLAPLVFILINIFTAFIIFWE